jgi:Na+/proline symporter
LFPSEVRIFSILRISQEPRANFFIVVLYTAVGGLKATFLTDFLHTAIALILIIYFTIAVLTNSSVGGLSGLYDKLIATAADNYIPGNYEGSLLTFKSKDAIIWGLILKFGNLALVVMVSRLPKAVFERPLAKNYRYSRNVKFLKS